MKILVRENLQTKEINIYGTDGKLHTGDFFDKYFSDTGGAYPILPYEREEFQTDSKFTEEFPEYHRGGSRSRHITRHIQKESSGVRREIPDREGRKKI